MYNIDNILYASPTMILRRKIDLSFCGTEHCCGYIYYLNGKKLDEPILEKPEDFEEVPENLPEILDKQYRESQYPIVVDQLIKQKYTQSDELAIQRQRDTKPDKFQEYFDYCEWCKQEAKYQLGLEPRPEPEPEPEPTPEESQPTEETVE